jgi:RNA recognition motif-containing protein
MRALFSMNIYVGNLPEQVQNDELKELFQRFGTVDAVRIIRDRVTGQPRGFGFVDMAEAAEGEKAIKELDNSMFKGKTICVNEARERKPRPGFHRDPRREGSRDSHDNREPHKE